MLELPEAVTISQQITTILIGKKIAQVISVQSPHKLAWYAGDPLDYPALLEGKTIDSARSIGGMIEVSLQGLFLLFSDGLNLRFHETDKKLPKKHQLLIEFNDATFLSAVVQMYGGLCCFQKGGYDNEYYQAAMAKPSPLSEDFSLTYFQQLLTTVKSTKLSTKAFLATEQRIPGLGNGVLQDILFNAQIHPKRKMNTLSKEEQKTLYQSIKDTLKEMSEKGGRDTEKDLYGNIGSYQTRLSKNTAGNPCFKCQTPIEKSSYMGGSIYICPVCQKL